MKKHNCYRNDEFRSLLNFRDIGGVPAAGNKRVKYGVIFRSANPDRIRRKDIEKLRKLTISGPLLICVHRRAQKRKFVSIDHAEKLTLSLDFQLKTRERLDRLFTGRMHNP